MASTKPVCLICLQNFDESRSDGGGLRSNDNLNKKFVDFLQHHLQIPPSSLALLLHNSNNSSLSSSLHLFCDDCKVVISGICTLFQELLGVQNKLREELAKLEEIIGGPGEENGENPIYSWVTSQLKGCPKTIRNGQVFELRILLKHYCKLETSKDVRFQKCEQSSPKKKTAPRKTSTSRVTRQVTRNLQALPPSSPSPPQITIEDNITIKEELPNQMETDGDSFYFEDEGDHDHDDNSRNSSDDDRSDSDRDQDNDWIQANDDNGPDDKPSSENDEDDDHDDDSDDDWNSSSNQRTNSPTTRKSASTRKSQGQRGPSISTSKKSEQKKHQKYHRRLVADKLNLYPDTIWSCDYCKSTLKSGNSLFTHLTYRHERSISSRTFPCYLCYRSFGFAQTRSIHLKLCHWKEQRLAFTCTASPSSDAPDLPCGAVSYDNPDSLLTHLQTDHSSESLHLCTICQWPFLSANSRILHELVHTPLPPGGLGYPCPMPGCTQYAGQMKHLIRHYSSKHDVSEGSFKCKICFKGFSNEATLNSHQLLHTIEEKQAVGEGELHPSDFKCVKCGKSHKNSKSLELHVNRKHTQQKCPHCGVEKYYDAYRKHLWVKHGIGKGSSHVCDKCGRECATKYALRKHMETSHHPEGKNRPAEWVCSECGKSYHGRVALHVHGVMKHMAREERDKLPVEVGKGSWKSKCLKCGKMFKAESHVLAHLYFMQKSCRRNQEKGGGGKEEGEMEQMKEWFGGQEGELERGMI